LLFWKGETLIDETKPLPVIIRGLVNDTPSGLRGVTNLINPSGVEVVPHPTTDLQGVTNSSIPPSSYREVITNESSPEAYNQYNDSKIK
jgi:hypothetical protein